MSDKISSLHLGILIFIMLAASSFLGVALKLMDTVEVDGKPFEHPFFQSLIMFMGESLWIFVYMFQKYQVVKQYGSVQASPTQIKAVSEGMKTNPNRLLFAVPMLCDATASTLLLIGYINIPASIVQMLGGFMVLVVAVMSMIFLKRKQHRHHWFGITLIFIGIGMVAMTALTNKGDSATKNPVLGIAMLIVSVIIQGWQFIVEEKLLGSYYVNPMKVVGWEGISGIVLFLILLPILQFVPCGAEICSNGVVEDSKLALTQISKSGELIFFVIMNIVLVGGMNGLGMVITKHASSASRVTLSQIKTVVVWVFFLVAPLVVNMRVKETFSFLQLGGFIVMLFGVVIYNEILTLPIMGLDKKTRANLEKITLRGKSLNHEEGSSMLDDSDELLKTTHSTDYTPTSPNKYDYQKNYRRLRDSMAKNSHDTSSGPNYIKIEED